MCVRSVNSFKCSAVVLMLAAIGLMGASASAHATTLLDLVNPSGQSNTPYALSFIATGASTTISIGGYQIPGSETTIDHGVFANGTGPNLFGGSFTFTPATMGSDASTFSDGTSVPALFFEGTTAGSYDTFSQTIATTVGVLYVLDFLYSNTSSPSNAPSGLLVTANASVVSTTPIPSTWTMMLAGLVVFGFMANGKRVWSDENTYGSARLS
jgi:hypothetical protein